MFVDSVKLTLSAGKGGNGAVAWRREKYIPKGGPTGGNGGNGGSIILKASKELHSLESLRNRRQISAENGQPGSSNHKQGKNGKNLTILIPCGTLVKDTKTNDVLFDFIEDGQEWCLCKGGKGGKGNAHFRSPTHQAPLTFTEGTFGEKKEIHLELKLIADVGLLGFPNAGKSTLLTQITKVPVKIASYPFTTLYPNLGFVVLENFSRILFADIPGIIKNAHEDKGLGISFLKHIERTGLLVYVIDISGFEERDPFEDFLILQNELFSYKEEMKNKAFLVALNKIDMEGAENNSRLFKERFPYNPSLIFEISAKEGEGLKSLLHAIKENIHTINKEPIKYL